MTKVPARYRLSQKAKFDPAVHISMKEMANRLKKSEHYVAYRVLPAYRVPRFFDGKKMFAERAQFNETLPKIKANLTESGTAKRGSLKRLTGATKKAKRSKKAAQNQSMADMKRDTLIPIEVTPEVLARLARSGMRFVVR